MPVFVHFPGVVDHMQRLLILISLSVLLACGLGFLLLDRIEPLAEGAVPPEEVAPRSADRGAASRPAEGWRDFRGSEGGAAAEERARVFFPEGALENELVFRFPSSAARRRYLEAIAGLPGVSVGTIPGLNAVRVRFDELALGASLQERLPRGAEAGYNYLVLSPTLPPPIEEVAGGPYLAFGDMAGDWLGISEDNADWGRGVTLAVLDTAIHNHPVFGGRFIPEVNLFDGELAGSSYQGHGTAVASLVAEVAPAAEMISIPVLDGDGAGNSFHLAQGIVEAVNRGAQVIPLALGTFGESSVLRDAVDYARRHDVLLVASAGNEGVTGLPYPARYDGVVAVTAVDMRGRRAPFANVDSQVDLAAPGVGVRAAWGDNAFTEFSGTSASAPLTAGAAVVLRAREPRLSASEAAAVLRETANDVGAPGHDSQTGHGLLNIDRALSRNESGRYDLALADFYLVPAEEGDQPVQVTVQNRGTEAVADVRLEVIHDGREETFTLGSLEASEVGYVEIAISPERLRSPEGVEILARTFSPGITDRRPENDSKGARLSLVPVDDEE